MSTRLLAREPVVRPRFAPRQRPRPELPEPVVTRHSVTYRDHDGIWWTVREERPAAAHDAPCLLFESPGRALRVQHFPRAWREFAAAGLVALSTAR